MLLDASERAGDLEPVAQQIRFALLMDGKLDLGVGDDPP